MFSRIKKAYKDNEVEILRNALIGAMIGGFIGGALLASKVAGERYPMSADIWKTLEGREGIVVYLRNGNNVLLEKN